MTFRWVYCLLSLDRWPVQSWLCLRWWLVIHSSGSSSKLCISTHILKWRHASHCVVVGSREVWHHLGVGASRNAPLATLPGRHWILALSGDKKESKAKVCASFKNLSSQITGEKKQYCKTYSGDSTPLLVHIQAHLPLKGPWEAYLVQPSTFRKWKWKWLSSVWLFATPWTVVHGILQARILEWVAFPFSRGSSQPRDQIQVSHIAGRFFTGWAIREAKE